MKYNEISTLMNDMYQVNAEGDTSVTLAPDLSNVVQFGKSLGDLATLWGQTANAFVDKVRNIVVLKSTFKKTGPSCYRNNEDWTGVTEVYRVSVGNFSESKQYDCVIPSNESYFTNSNSFNDLFGKEMPEVKVSYYEGVNKYRKKITISADQFITAFTSPSAMASFWAEVERKVQEQWEYAKECLEYLAMDAGLMKTAYDRTDLEEGTSNSIILKEYTSMDELYTTIADIMDDMEQYNNAYSDKDYVSSVYDENLVCYMRSDVYNKFISQLNSYAGYNAEAVKTVLSRFRKIPMWQSRTDRKNITVDMSTFDKTVTEGTKTVTLRNIEWAIFDKRLFGCTSSQEKITSQYVANEDVTNYFHMATTAYRLNECLPCVICCDCDDLSDALVIE